MGWLVAAGILTILALMPVGVLARYNDQGFAAAVVLGPFRLSVYPRNKRGKKKKNAEKSKKQPKSSKKSSAPQKKRPGGSIQDFQGIIREIIAFLGTFRRKLIVRNLQLHFLMAGGDPADLARNYGYAWAAVGNLVPQLERVFYIKKRAVSVDCDFLAEQTKISMELDAVITLGRIIVISGWHVLRILREFIKLKNSRKGGNHI